MKKLLLLAAVATTLFAGISATPAVGDPLDKSSPKIAHRTYRDRGKSSPKIAHGTYRDRGKSSPKIAHGIYRDRGKSSPKIAHGIYRDRGKSSPKIAHGMNQGGDYFDDELFFILDELMYELLGR